jgi:hypothetical protein
LLVEGNERGDEMGPGLSLLSSIMESCVVTMENWHKDSMIKGEKSLTSKFHLSFQALSWLKAV